MPQLWVVAGPNGAGKTTINLPTWAREAIPDPFLRSRNSSFEP